MTVLTDDDDTNKFAIALVREIAAGTGLTTIAKISESDEMVWATTESFLPNDINEASYGALLHATARLERGNPHPDNVVFACALVLPERDVAYLHSTTASGTSTMTLTVGPNPQDDPDIRAAVMDGLAALMRAVLDTRQPSRTSGRAFVNPARTPAARPPNRPGLDFPPPTNGFHHNGPHR